MESNLRDQIIAFSREAISLADRCANEESTKLYLVLPFIKILGFDYQNPNDVIPEHSADFSEKYKNRVDYALIAEGQPCMAVECKSVFSPLRDERGQLRSYFNAMATVRVGVLTNGLDYEFYVDSVQPNIMDEAPFLSVSLQEVAKGAIPKRSLRHIRNLTKEKYHPPTVIETAKRQLLHDQLVDDFIQELKSPTDDLCRFFLKKFDLSYLSKKQIDEVYRAVVKTAFEEALAIQILRKLQIDKPFDGAHAVDNPQESENSQIETTSRELAIYAYCKRRLAYLVEDDRHFIEIECIEYKDYMSKFVIFYRKSFKGRLLEFIEGEDGFDTYIFPDDMGEISTNNILDLDKPLLEIFHRRVRELGDSTSFAQSA